MAGHYQNTVEDLNTGRPVNGATIKVYEDGANISGSSVTTGTLATIYSDDGITPIDQTNSPLTTAADGEFDFYTDETRVVIAVLFNGSGLAVWNDVDIPGAGVVGDVTALTARVDKHDTVFGLAASAIDLGTFTGAVITDNVDVKTALQELETEVELANGAIVQSISSLADPNTDSVLIWDDTAGAMAWSNELYVDADLGRVGVGVSTPLAELHVRGDATDAQFFLKNTAGQGLQLTGGTSGVDISILNSLPITFATAGSERMRIDSSGNVGVGNTPSGSYKLEVTGAGSFSTSLVVNSVNVLTESLQYACSDESTAIDATGTKLTFRMPFAMTLTGVRASLNSACTTGTFTVDINEGGTTILSTKLTIDATEKTSTTAATAAVISDSALADDAEITIDVDNVGDSTATGLKVTLIGTRT